MSITRRDSIAIVGATAIFPGSNDARGFWNDIVSGRDLLTDIPPHYWLIEDYYDPDPTAPDKTYGRRGAFLNRVEFDSLEFGLPPAALPAIDSSQLLALVGAKRVLADAAGGREERLPKERVGVFLGVAANTSAAMQLSARLQRPAWIKGMREAGILESHVQEACDRIAACYTPIQENTFPGSLSNVVAGRIANRFDLQGSNFTIDAACASSLAAISVGINELLLGNADMVLSGGVDTFNDPQMYLCFSKTPALSPTGDCRPFSSGADGTILGEGLAMFALKRLADADRDRDRIYAVIRGMGSSSDGLAKSVYAPRPAGQALALRRTYEMAGYGPETVELMEAHGTATPAGDQAEFEALREVFSEAKPFHRQWCALGSVKSQLGHTKGAAGAAGLFKAAMALHHKVLPPTIKVDQPNPTMAIEDSPFYINTEARPWIADGVNPRRASSSSFGFGGANFHVTLEEYRGSGPKPPRLTESPVELTLIAASNTNAAVGECRRIETNAKEDWRAVARESQRAFDPSANVRIAIVASAQTDLERKLARVVSALEGFPEKGIHDPDGIYYEPLPVSGPIAFIFSGQGSQYVGMGKGLAMAFDCALAIWDFAEKEFLGRGFSPRDAGFPRPVFNESDRRRQEEFLTRTENGQPSLAVASLAQLSVLQTLGVQPDFAAGHSFGELVALHTAGCFSASDLLRIARKRGELMAASPSGTMTAVLHPIDDLRTFFDHHRAGPGESNGIVIANYNAPRQAVLSGRVASLEAVEARLAAASISFRRLPVSGAFHSPLMSEAVEPFFRFLEHEVTIGSPTLPVFSNATAAAYPSDARAVSQRIAANLIEPVRFLDEIEALHQAGARTFVEVGAGSVLRQLTAQCLHGKPHTAIALSHKGQHDVTALWHAVGQLSLAGIGLQLETLWQAFHPVTRKASATTRPSSTVLIDGVGYNRPYPPKGGKAALPSPNVAPSQQPVVARPAAVAVEVSAPQAPISNASVSQETPRLPEFRKVPEVRTSTATAPVSGSAFELIQMQISEMQRASQAAILESLTITLKSMETLAKEFHGHQIPQDNADLPPISQHGNPPLRNLASVLAPEVALIPDVATPPAALPISVKLSAPSPQLAMAEPVTVDPSAILLQIVSEKTGYPEDVLGLDVELEAGLGIDSIKRVEIFSALQRHLPGLPEVTPAVMAELKTLRDILAFLSGPSSFASAPGLVSSVGNSAATVEETGPVSAASAASVERALLEIVSEKTGYPQEVLDLDVELEAGFGIDSIKRVEIFSAIQQRVPDIPEVKPEDAARLRTLRDIIQFAVGENTTSPEIADAISRSEVHWVQSEPCGLPMPALFSCPSIAVIDPGSGIGEAIAARLSKVNISAQVTATVPDGCRAAIYLGGLRYFGSPEEALRVNYEAFEIARSLARTPESPSFFVTAQNTAGDTAVWASGMAGITKTFSREWPDAGVKTIDADWRQGEGPARIADLIIQELLTGGDQLEVTLSTGGLRLIPVLHPAERCENANRIGEKSVVLAAGGGRGVTAACLIALAKAAKPRVAILGRSVLEDEPADCLHAQSEAEIKRVLALRPGRTGDLKAVSQEAARILAAREVRSTLQSLEQAGSSCQYFAVDIKDPVSVGRAVAFAREQFGPITAIVHGAGVISDKKIADKTSDQFGLVFETKVSGLRALLAATESDPIDTICFFSSVAGRFGNAGQCDYAAANEVLNRVAASEAKRRGATTLVRSIDWGPWDGGMVTTALAAHFRSHGTGLISLATGADAFVRELQHPLAAAEVVIAANSELFTETAPYSGKPLEILVSRATYPILDSHRVQENAVVPVVLVNEWFHRFAESRWPAMRVASCRDLKVLRGIPLPEFEAAGHLLRITAKRRAGAEIQCELRSSDGTLRYSAILELQKKEIFRGALPKASPRYRANADKESAVAVYRPGNDLFHGPDFHVIEAIGAIDESGAHGTLRTTRGMQWKSGPWTTDAAALDGALQLIRLWGIRHLGGPSLPTRIGSFVSYREEIPPDSVHCEIQARQTGRLGISAGVQLFQSDGSILAEMCDVEAHLAPNA